MMRDELIDIDFITDLEDYLFNWSCIYTGEYKPLSRKFWNKEFIPWAEKQNGTVISVVKTYKKEVENKNFPLTINCIGLMPWYKKNLYDEKLDKINAFEKKYKFEK